MVKEMRLTQGQVALVDDEDYEWLNQWKWQAKHDKSTKGYYAVRSKYEGYVDGKDICKCVLMHRAIMSKIIHNELNSSKEVDHINHDTLDNTRTNLRIVSSRQNRQNLKKQSSSKYPGVTWKKRDQKWQAQIQVNGSYRYIGVFDEERSAAKAYEMAQRLYCDENLVCKLKNEASYKTSKKFTPIWELKITTSRYKGVCWKKDAKKWVARIIVNDKREHLGYFMIEEEAAQAYEHRYNQINGVV
jgi:plasmid maintenance system killer protein